MAGSIDYRSWDASLDAAMEPLLGLYRAVFEGADESYLLARFPEIADPMLWIAEDDEGWVGFKLGYRRGATLYSWLGGVLPRARGRHVASQLTVFQHEAAAARGYRDVETRTRTSNNAMLILNLKHGFHITGFTIDARDVPVVILRKVLNTAQ